MIDPASETSATRRRYDRIAPAYDLFEKLVEAVIYQDWRKMIWEKLEGGKVLEVGVGTGKNIPYYPSGGQVSGIDLSPKMLARAFRRRDQLGAHVELSVMDVQDLEFADGSFDAAVATFVFCSVPDPVRGIAELRRVVRPGGQILLLEHTRAKVDWLGRFMDAVDPLAVRVMGPHINRKTVENAQAGGLQIETVDDLDSLGVFKVISARVPVDSQDARSSRSTMHTTITS